jgi:hypothetical membrane protein
VEPVLAKDSMLTPRQSSWLVVISAAIVLVGTLGFAALRPEYRHVANTISELGEYGAIHFRLVGFGVFLPAGLFLWLGLWGAHLQDRRRATTLTLMALASLGVGYVGAAFFPCDPGSPLSGTVRQQVHNVIGFIEYFGTGVGFLLMAIASFRRGSISVGTAWAIVGLVAWTGVALLGFEPVFAFRGAIQRFTEALLFSGTFVAVKTLLPTV